MALEVSVPSDQRTTVSNIAISLIEVNECKRLCLLKKSGFTARFLSVLACWLVASLVSPVWLDYCP